jgi:hypothetical protein
LHLLLVAATLLVAWPPGAKLVALVAVTGHAALRRPRPPPARVVIGANAACAVAHRSSPVALGPRTVVCSHWVRLDLGTGPRPRDIVLFADQLDPEAWARLRALLARGR